MPSRARPSISMNRSVSLHIDLWSVRQKSKHWHDCAAICQWPPSAGCRRKDGAASARASGAHAEAGNHLLRPAPGLRWPNRLQREKLLSALTARFIAIGSSMKCPLCAAPPGPAPGRAPPSRLDRAVATAGRSARHAAPGFCWRRTSALHSSVLPAPASPAIPGIPPSVGAAKYPVATPHHARPSICSSTSSPCGGRGGGKISLSSWPSIFSTICSPLSGAIGPLSISRPVAQHRQGVADCLQFMDTMRNKHHPDPLLLQTAYYRKQSLTFMLIQRRGGLIEDQKRQWCDRARASRICCFSASVQLSMERLTSSATSSCASASRASCRTRDQRNAMPGLCQPVQHDVFRNAQASTSATPLLLHRWIPQLFSIPRRTNDDRLVVDRHLAFIMSVGAAQHRHQRRLHPRRWPRSGHAPTRHERVKSTLFSA